jgi:hypothetical protein
MSENFYCWKCASQLQSVILPMSRREECESCKTDQHVCKMCNHFNGTRGCEEDRAETVSDPEKANFCDYFRPTQDNRGSAQSISKSSLAKAQLAALFGDPEPEQQTNTELSPAEIAEQKLRDLLGG